MPNIDTTENTSSGMKFISPENIIKEIDIKPGAVIADLGCGTGYFSIPLAKKVGKEGRVYSIDILKTKLEVVKSQARLLGLDNIIIQRANLEVPEGSKLSKESVDWVMLVNMLFQSNKEGKDKIICEAKRILKKGGQMLVVEWGEQNSNIGPDKDLRVSKEELVRMAHEHGLGVIKEMNIGDFHYGLILAKYK
jgi:ubiquinone/menaquinone biosynthesis C-methylase UbiE